MATCVFEGIKLDEFLDREETKFYKIPDVDMSPEKFLKLFPEYSSENLEKKKDKLYPLPKPIVIETPPANPDLEFVKNYYGDRETPETFEETMKRINIERQKRETAKRHRKVGEWYILYKTDIDRMFNMAFNTYNYYGSVFNTEKQDMYNDFVDMLYDKYA